MNARMHKSGLCLTFYRPITYKTTIKQQYGSCTTLKDAKNKNILNGNCRLKNCLLLMMIISHTVLDGVMRMNDHLNAKCLRF